jgi:hypothetical protein
MEPVGSAQDMPHGVVIDLRLRGDSGPVILSAAKELHLGLIQILPRFVPQNDPNTFKPAHYSRA